MADKRDPADYYRGEHPGTRPEGSEASMFIQWKGTDVCVDFQCACGSNGHFDGYFAYIIKCPDCGQHYSMGTQVIAKKVDGPDGRTIAVLTDTVDTSEEEIE